MKHWVWLLSLFCAPAFAAEECYTADATGGGVTFSVLQAGAPATGEFRRFSGEACFSQGRITRIEASLDPSSVDTGLPELDEGLKKKDFFAVNEYPRVSFVSSAVQSQGNMHTVHGTLEIKGNRREIDVVLRSQPSGNKMSIAGSFVLDRLQYGIGTGEWTNTNWLGAEVKLEINATMTRKP